MLLRAGEERKQPGRPHLVLLGAGEGGSTQADPSEVSDRCGAHDFHSRLTCVSHVLLSVCFKQHKILSKGEDQEEGKKEGKETSASEEHGRSN